jgi:hypothetical protein
VFTAGNLLREARRQRRLPEFRVPAACLLDPDGDVVRHLTSRGAAADQSSLHYQPASEWSHLQPHLAERLATALEQLGETVFTGVSWTTDAPFRETPAAAGLYAYAYAYAAARHRDVVCVAHVTNTMATRGGDFDKGEQDGTTRILALAAAITRAVLR